MRNYGFEVEVCYISRKTSSLHYIHINTYPVYFFWIHLTTLIVLRNHRSAILLVIIVLPFRRSFCFLLFVLYVGYLTYSNDVRTKRACKFQAGKIIKKNEKKNMLQPTLREFSSPCSTGTAATASSSDTSAVTI